MFQNSVKQLTKEDYFTKPELSALAMTLGKDRDSLLFKTALITGARQGELIMLAKKSLNLDAGTIHIKANKGSNDREVRVSKEHIKLLLQLPTDLLFPICESRVRYIWYDKRPAALIKKFHAFRHTFGVELYRATKDVMLVKKAMGHKSLTSTLVYVDCVNYADQMETSYVALDGLLDKD
jgi:integrase